MDNSRAPSCHQYVVSSPLWSRAPSRDEKGKPYSDFMMLIPGLKQQDDAGIERCLVKIRQSLAEFENVVVYVDLNIKLSLLWISHKPVPGITKPMVLSIQKELPHAKVIASDFNPGPESATRSSQHWLSSFGRRLKSGLKLLGKG